MRIDRNIVANYAARLWAGVATFIFVPLYARLLDPAEFGLISFAASILGIVFIMDMGLASAFAREMARERDADRLGHLLRSLEIVYLAVIAAVAIGSIWLADFVAATWLNAPTIDESIVRLCVMLMIISAALQVMISLYIGGLLGANVHMKAAKVQIGFSVVRSGLVLVPLYFYPDPVMFCAWQLVAALACLVIVRIQVWRIVSPSVAPRFSVEALHAIKAFAGGMFGIAVISAINFQSDKIIVSKLFSVAEFGRYAVASLVGQIPAMAALPLAVTALPQLTRHASAGDLDNQIPVYDRFSFMIAALSATAALFSVLAMPEILAFVFAQPPDSQLIATARVLAVGGAFLAAQYMPYHLAIAHGHTRTSVLLGLLSAATLPAAMIAGAARWGLIGIAIPWLIVNFVVATILAWSMTRRFLGSHLRSWVVRMWALPTLAAVPAAAAGGAMAFEVEGLYWSLMVFALFALLASATNLVIYQRLFKTRTGSEARANG